MDTTVLGELTTDPSARLRRIAASQVWLYGYSLHCPALAMHSRLVCQLRHMSQGRHCLPRHPSCSCCTYQVSLNRLGLAQMPDNTSAGLSQEEAAASPFIASMGIYVFKKDLMLKLLREQGKSNDFGGEIIPSAAASSRVMAYLFNGYWEDIGTIKSFFEANLALAQHVCSTLPALIHKI